ncbi:transcription negative regulator ChrR [Sneathiella sp. P13V-1]|uniref:cupin domain-containing protein n=1 Tax=Sneathiella sp. P13V-1 TaxID=2697366 RepID=UPI00187B7102|nr:cupin domain-containing protein [Sneathiella sp. P13V-1]MBE7635267.1 transcription negative regulator ChrR [Sneathiella sp. P13V-1]
MVKAFSVPDVLLDKAARETLQWEYFREGIEVSWLYKGTDENPASAAFLKYQPGAEVPTHSHPGMEHILVLEGAQQDENGSFPAGSIVVNPTNTVHSVSSPEGCLVLAIWEKPVAFL